MKKYVEVDREPRVGDMVKVIRTTVVPKTNGIADYKVGDVLKIVAKLEGGYRYSDDYFADSGIQRVLQRKEFVVVEQVTCEFTKSDIKPCMVIRLRDEELYIVSESKEGLCLNDKEGSFMKLSGYNDDMTCYKNATYDIIEVYSLKAMWKANEISTDERELLFKREDVEDLGKKEYVIESIEDDNEITITYNHPNGYDDSDDSIHILVGDDLSDDYAFTTISIQSAKDMISALQEIVDYVEGGK